MRNLKKSLGLPLALIFLSFIAGYAHAQSRGERSRVYPLFAYGKFWGIAEPLFKDEGIHALGGKVVASWQTPTATGEIFKRLGIPIPLSNINEIAVPPAERERISNLRAALASHYGPTLRFRNDFKFRELLRPAELFKTQFGHTSLTVHVVTTQGSFVTVISKVFVQEADVGGCGDQIFLYAFDASRRTGMPLFAVPVSKKRRRPATVSFQAPSGPAQEGSPHAYALTGKGVHAKISLEVVPSLRPLDPGAACPRDAPDRCVPIKIYRLAVKDTQDQVTFSQDFSHPEDGYASELYLSPPIRFSDSPLPFFVVYSGGNWVCEQGGGCWGDWWYTRYIFQLAPEGKLKQIASEALDIGGVGCE